MHYLNLKKMNPFCLISPPQWLIKAIARLSYDGESIMFADFVSSLALQVSKSSVGTKSHGNDPAVGRSSRLLVGRGKFRSVLPSYSRLMV